MTEEGRVNELQDLVLTRLAELGEPGSPMSYRQASERGRGLINYETFRLIARGEHSGRLTDRSAEGLARAIDVPVAEIYRVARVPRPTTRWHWPAKFDRLDLQQRRLIEDMARALLEAYEKGVRDATR